jgi:acetyl esterase
VQSDLHPQSVALLERLGAPPTRYSVDLARQGHARTSQWICGAAPSIDKIDEWLVPADFAPGVHALERARLQSVDGLQQLAQPVSVRVRRFVPNAQTRTALVWLHGGGWVQGTLDTNDIVCRHLALACDAQVLAVDYRLSPEVSFPAPIGDAARAFAWVHGQASSLNLNPDRIALGGDSAGGHLAITAARWLREAGLPTPAALSLVYPVADRGLNTPSMQQYESGYYLSRAQMNWFWSIFLGGLAVPDTHPDLSPVLASDLAGLPATHVLLAQCDILRDEGLALAARLAQAGVPVSLDCLPGMLHGFIRFGACVDGAHEATACVGRQLKHRLSG